VRMKLHHKEGRKHSATFGVSKKGRGGGGERGGGRGGGGGGENEIAVELIARSLCL